MASSRKPRNASRAGGGLLAAAQAVLDSRQLRGKRMAVALSGGVDSVVLLHVLRELAPRYGYRLSALHVNHGLSPNAGKWRSFCEGLCKSWKVPFSARRVRVAKTGRGLEDAAREARYAAFKKLRVDAFALGHQLDDQAETLLLNLLRGAGLRGASGMPAVGQLGRRLLLRPLLEVPREAVTAYAKAHRLEWIEDESNSDEALTRNFLRRRVAPLLDLKYPRWREALARAARHFAARDADANRLLREFLAARGLRAPSERTLLEMLRQLGSAAPGARTALVHDGAVLRVYRDELSVGRATPAQTFAPIRWEGEMRLAIPALGGELRFRRTRSAGIDRARLESQKVTIRTRSGGERLQPDARRPRRTLKNLFQEAGIPPWERARLPLVFCGAMLAWAPGLGVDASFLASRGAAGLLPEWRRLPRLP